MAFAKAEYKGNGAGEMIPDFSDKLKSTLRSYYPDQDAESDETFGHPADGFVNHVLNEAWWAKSELDSQTFDITKQQIRAEQADIMKVLSDAHCKLRSLSPDFDRLLGVDADVWGCAAKIKELIGQVEHAKQRIDLLPTARKPADKQHAMAVEMAVRVLRVLKSYEIKPSATCGSHFSYTSDAVQILKAIGDDIGLVLADLTWRDTIIKAKGVAPDLQ